MPKRRRPSSNYIYFDGRYMHFQFERVFNLEASLQVPANTTKMLYIGAKNDGTRDRES